MPLYARLRKMVREELGHVDWHREASGVGAVAWR